jgi:hypothetical protein
MLCTTSFHHDKAQKTIQPNGHEKRYTDVFLPKMTIKKMKGIWNAKPMSLHFSL